MDAIKTAGEWGGVSSPEVFAPRYAEVAVKAGKRSRRKERADEQLIREVVALLSAASFAAIFSEVVRELGIREASELQRRRREVLPRLSALFPYDVRRTVDEGRRILAAGLAVGEPRTDVFSLPWDEQLRYFGATSAMFPIDGIEQWARACDLPEVAHQARVTFDLLRGFLLRNEAPERLRTAGQAYATGKLSLGEVALLLGLSERDTVFELERAGYYRSLDTIMAAQRPDTLAKIAARVAANGGQPFELSEDEVRRDVVASQRIEGIDARRWM